MRNFGVLILSHGRPTEVYTHDSLMRSTYSGPWRIVVDDEDPDADEYRERFGAEQVVEFSKAEVAPEVDVGDSIQDRRGVVFARNAAFKIARELGWEYFVEFDDDYDTFRYRFIGDDGFFRSTLIRRMDDAIEATLEFLDATGAACVAWSQGGDHMGGLGGNLRKGFLRKAMNSMFFRTDRPVRFVGRVNEDVSAYVLAGGRGDLFFTVMPLFLNQHQTQEHEGGLTDLYLDQGTYVKSFYSVMMAPSCVSISTMGRIDRRFHHRVDWDRAVPKILGAEHQKGGPRAARPLT